MYYKYTNILYIEYYIIAHNSYMYYNDEGVSSQVHVYYTIHTCIHGYMHTCIHAYIHTYIHVHTCACTYIHTYIVFVHTNIHIYIHT